MAGNALQSLSWTTSATQRGKPCPFHNNYSKSWIEKSPNTETACILCAKLLSWWGEMVGRDYLFLTVSSSVTSHLIVTRRCQRVKNRKGNEANRGQRKGHRPGMVLHPFCTHTAHSVPRALHGTLGLLLFLSTHWRPWGLQLPFLCFVLLPITPAFGGILSPKSFME